jgi:nucleotidyltransferase substrate binding protein (TIGR01987 family)
MDIHLDRLKQRLNSFQNALMRIEEIAPRIKELSLIEQDGLIQRFEFTFELSWKVMQDYLIYAGYNNVTGPRAVIAQMGKDGFLDPNKWYILLDARNELSHVYDEEQSRKHVQLIIDEYLSVFQNLRERLLEVLWLTIL